MDNEEMMASLANKTVMIVDDTSFMRNIIKRAFEKAGCQVVAECENGHEAVAMYQAHRPDLVAMDIVMPQMDGLEALSQIKAMDPDARIVVVSSLGTEDKVETALGLGAKSFILKPFKAPELLSVFAEALAV